MADIVQPQARHCPTCGQPIRGIEEQLRIAVRDAVEASDMPQTQIAALANISQKHLSGIVTGRAGLTNDLAELLLGILGRAAAVTIQAVP